jgi:dipeptidyl aminopeptidase/acylaminoacyl peptidase
MLYDRAAKTTKEMLPKFGNWIDEFAWASNSKMIFFVSGTEGEAPIKVVTVNEESENRGEPYTLFTVINVPGEYSDLHPLAKSNMLIAVRMSVDKPSEVVSISWSSLKSIDPLPPGGVITKAWAGQIENRSLSHLNDSLLGQLDLSKMENFWFNAADGVKVQGFLIKPPAFDPTKKYPVKFLIHGGPQGAWGDAWSYRWNAELFAANGYVVVMINPGGSTGYGQAFVDRVNGDWGGKPYTDLMTGLDYAEQHYPFIDKTRECALGASYGGYMANWILGHTNRFKCIVSHDSMFNAESAFGTTEEDWFNIWEFKAPNTNGSRPWDFYGKPDGENPFRKFSPSVYAKNFKTPTLVVHGQLDYRLDVSEGFQLFDTLQMLHVPSKMLYFPDEGHWVLKPQNSQLWYKTVNDWVDQWTKEAGARQ